VRPTAHKRPQPSILRERVCVNAPSPAAPSSLSVGRCSLLPLGSPRHEHVVAPPSPRRSTSVLHGGGNSHIGCSTTQRRRHLERMPAGKTGITEANVGVEQSDRSWVSGTAAEAGMTESIDRKPQRA
jgi:hypothetical protein